MASGTVTNWQSTEAGATAGRKLGSLNANLSVQQFGADDSLVGYPTPGRGAEGEND